MNTGRTTGSAPVSKTVVAVTPLPRVRIPPPPLSTGSGTAGRPELLARRDDEHRPALREVLAHRLSVVANGLAAAFGLARARAGARDVRRLESHRARLL